MFAKLTNFLSFRNFIISRILEIQHSAKHNWRNIKSFPSIFKAPLTKMFSIDSRSRKEFHRISYLKRIILGHRKDLSVVANLEAETYLPANLSKVRGARFKPAWRELIERRSLLVDCPSAPIRKFEVKLRTKKVGSDWVTRDGDRGRALRTGPKDRGNRRQRNANGLGRKAD